MTLFTRKQESFWTNNGFFLPPYIAQR